MEKEIKYFPFGKPLQQVKQKDQTPKEVFVLGVYASAVHARWLDSRNKQIVAALAVASEPEIFWRGEDADKIINEINIPTEIGHLEPAARNLNGPSGNVLDNLILAPLGYKRENSWLCDLLPESRVNKKQRLVIDKFYKQVINKYNLPEATIPDFDNSELDSLERREEILLELEASNAKTIILLGDLPIQKFIKYHDKRYSRLADFGETIDLYGKSHEIEINNKKYSVIPLCHPRQAGKLGASSTKWGELHDNWVKRNLAVLEVFSF